MVFAVLIAAGFLPWHQTVAVPVTISATHATTSVRARETGTLAALQVADGQMLAEGQPIAFIGVKADLAQLQRVEAYVAQVVAALRESSLPPPAPAIAIGGSIQSAFDALGKAVFELRAATAFDVRDARVTGRRRDVAALAERLATGGGEIALQQQVVSVTRDRLRRYEELAKRGYVSVDAMSALRQQLLRDQIALENARTEREELERQLTRARSELTELELDDEVSRRELRRAVHQATEALSGEIRGRQVRSVVTAPVAGRIHFPRFHALGDPINSGQEFAVIVPEGRRLTATGSVPATARTNIGVGADVRVETRGYPSVDYGFLRGRVGAVTNVATDGAYAIRIDLPSDARTSRGAVLTLRNRTAGTGIIRVESGTIHSTLFGRLRKRLLNS